MTKLLREPLIHFLLAGAVLYWLNHLIHPSQATPETATVIEISDTTYRQLLKQWRKAGRAVEDPTTLKRLMDDYLREETLYREALRLGLDQGDLVIRRRLVQKMDYLAENLADINRLTDKDIEQYYQQHADQYRNPPRYTFQLVVIRGAESPDEKRQRALTALERLNQLDPADPGWKGLGDPSGLAREYQVQTPRTIRKLLGPELAATIPQAPLQQWSGPYTSGSSLLLIRKTMEQPGPLSPLESIYNRVVMDLLNSRKQEARATFYRKLKQKYQYVWPEHPKPEIDS